MVLCEYYVNVLGSNRHQLRVNGTGCGWGGQKLALSDGKN